MATEADQDDIRIKVGGLWVILDPATYLKMNSPVLNALIFADSDSSQENAKANEYSVEEADHESFTTFIMMTRYDTLPVSILTCTEKRNKLLREALFWGIRIAVDRALAKAEGDVEKLLQGRGADEGGATAESEPPPLAPRAEEEPSCHHNERKAESRDISFGTFCTLCDFGQEKSVFLTGESYSHCEQCHKEILYKSDLDWCHKCRCCVDCQAERCPDASIVPSERRLEMLSMFSKLEDKIKTLRDNVSHPLLVLERKEIE